MCANFTCCTYQLHFNHQVFLCDLIDTVLLPKFNVYTQLTLRFMKVLCVQNKHKDVFQELKLANTEKGITQKTNQNDFYAEVVLLHSLNFISKE